MNGNSGRCVAATTTLVVLITAVVLMAEGPFDMAQGEPFDAAQGKPAIKLRVISVSAPTLGPMTIELHRWSTDAERAPIHTALATPPPPPPAPAGPAGATAGRGRAARGGRGAPAAPLSPEARLSAAVKTAPTSGFIWGDGPTGFSIKYAWRAPSSDNGLDRIVLVTDRRMGAHLPSSAPTGAAVEGDYTVIEMRIDAKGNGEGKTSHSTKVVMDAAANALTLEGYAAAPTQLKVTR